MFGLSSFSIIGIACAVAFGVGGTAGYKVTRAHYEHAIAKAEEAHREAIDKANVNAEAAAELYEAARAKQYTRTVVITKEVSHAIETAPAWASEPLPSGVRDAIAHAAEPDPGEPAGPVSIEPASSDDQRRDGIGLRAVPVGVPGVPSAP